MKVGCYTEKYAGANIANLLTNIQTNTFTRIQTNIWTNKFARIQTNLKICTKSPSMLKIKDMASTAGWETEGVK